MNEKFLAQQLKCIFPPPILIHENVKKLLSIKFPSDTYMEFDIWIPKYKISFEFQDEYHYVSAWYHQDTTSSVQAKDKMKNEVAQQHGISLVVVPCWWDGAIESLIRTIQFVRPDIPFVAQKIDRSDPIPLFPPPKFFPDTEIPLVGELMLASFPRHHRFSEGGFKWWIGEKYDGVRCCWNPIKQTAYTRNGNQVMLLPEFRKFLPAEFIDSEFWFGRGRFSHTYALISGGSDASIYDWHLLRIISFDVASVMFHRKPFEDRYSHLLFAIDKQNPLNIIASRMLHKNRKNLKLLLKSIIDNEGEGIIIRKHSSLYEPGRSQSLLKIKALVEDREAIVVGIREDHSVTLKLPNGSTFSVPAENVLIKVGVGDVVSFSFENYSRREIPVNPKIFRKRHDLIWEDLVRSFHKDSRSQYVAGFTQKPQGYWSHKNRRFLLEQVAKSMNFDPLLPDMWYSVISNSIIPNKRIEAILKYHNNSLTQAVLDLFPDIGLDHEKIGKHLRMNNIEQRRKFFEDYAKSNDFDPQNPENWYLQSRKKILQTKGAAGLLEYYDRSIPNALIQLFPNIGLVLSKFPKKFRKWDAENRRKFFIAYAKTHKFDPHSPAQWYSQSKEQILSFKGAHRILAYYGGSISKALCDLFPSMAFEPSKFKSHASTMVMRKEQEKRRKWMENYAKASGFDPLTPENWYPQTIAKISAVKGGTTVLEHYKNSLASTLIDLFPNIGLDRGKFHRAHYWTVKENRRKFFEKYALQFGFDPKNPESWYSQPKKQILNFEKGKVLLRYYDFRIPAALIDAFPEIGMVAEKFPYK